MRRNNQQYASETETYSYMQQIIYTEAINGNKWYYKVNYEKWL